MDLELFRTALEHHGARLADWPATVRAAAQTLLATSPEARTAMAATERHECALAMALGPIELPHRLAARLAAIPSGVPLPSPWWHRLLTARPLAVAGGMATLTAAALFGVWIGAGALTPPAEDDAAALLHLLDLSMAELGDAS